MSMKLLPQSSDAEYSTLSAFFLCPKEMGAFLTSRGIAEPHFHIPAHQTIYRAMMDLWTQGTPLDFISITQLLRDRNQLEEVGGAVVISKLAYYLPSATNAEYYIGILQEKHLLRRVISISAAATDAAYNEQEDVPKLLNTLVDGVNALVVPTSSNTPSLSELAMERINQIQTGEDLSKRILTGIKKLDECSPLNLGDMPLISGKRKSGKSMLAITIAMNLMEQGKQVLYFTLEMTSQQVMSRMFAHKCRIPIIEQHHLSLKEWHMPAYQKACALFSKNLMTIHHDVHRLADIIAIARQQKAKYPGLAAIIVDYAQLVKADLAKGKSRQEEVAKISWDLRLLSLELEVAILLLCQLNKDGDTRESAALEQDCTAMWKVVEPDEGEDAKPNTRFINVPFQRNGEGGIGFPVTFLPQYSSFENYAHE